jgi:hypothetical protein
MLMEYSGAGKAEEVIVVINQAHPHRAQLKGSKGVLNFIRHCTWPSHLAKSS